MKRMTYTEILELIRAGFTKDEINAMMKDTEPEKIPEKPPENKEPTPVPPTDPAPTGTPEQKPTPVPENKEPTETEKLLSALGMQITTLTNAIHAANVAGAEGKTPTEDTPESIIARIINPNQ